MERKTRRWDRGTFSVSKLHKGDETQSAYAKDVLLLPETTKTRGHHAVFYIEAVKRIERQNIMIRQHFQAKLLMKWNNRRAIKFGGR